MNTDFLAGILVARMLEGMHFAVGPTIAARRSALALIGGFDRLKDYLAEDFVMGKFAAEAGHGVILSSGVVEHHIGSTDLAQNAAHRLRWTRSTRRSSPWGYFGPVVHHAFTASDCAGCNPSGLLARCVGGIAMRLAAAYVVSVRVLHVRLNWLLLPVEDWPCSASGSRDFSEKRLSGEAAATNSTPTDASRSRPWNELARIHGQGLLRRPFC